MTPPTRQLVAVVLPVAMFACGGSGAVPNGEVVAPERHAPVAPEEPITFRLEGWRASTTAGSETATWRHSELTSPSGSCLVVVDRWWGLPPDTGGAAREESSRPVAVDGVPLSVATMSLFEGTAQHVDALYIAAGTANVRLVFRRCSPPEIDSVLADARLSASVKVAAKH
jgi:hypothetical protein